MKISLTKTYRMHRFMNASHSLAMRLGAGLVAYPSIALATGSHVLAREMFGRFFRRDDFKTGLRRGAWYARRSWVNLDVSKDELYDFTDGLDQDELARIDRFVIARSRDRNRLIDISDRLYIAARQSVLAYGTHAWESHIGRYHELAGQLADGVNLTGADALAVPDEKVTTRKGDFALPNARQALLDFAEIFPNARWPWYLISGTFLGLIRENGFLPHDYDIDLGLHSEAADIGAVTAAIRADPRFVMRKNDSHQTFRREDGQSVASTPVPALIKLTHHRGVHIDLFIHHREGDVVWHGSSLHRWENTPFEIATYDFCGMQVFAPRDADRYLTENYGNWRVPVTEFNCSTDTTNQAVVRHPLAVAIFMRRLVLEQGRDARVASGLAALLVRQGYLLETTPGRFRFASNVF